MSRCRTGDGTVEGNNLSVVGGLRHSLLGNPVGAGSGWDSHSSVCVRERRHRVVVVESSFGLRSHTTCSDRDGRGGGPVEGSAPFPTYRVIPLLTKLKIRSTPLLPLNKEERSG